LLAPIAQAADSEEDKTFYFLGTEDIYKIYAESFKGQEHLQRIQGEARDIVAAALSA
jgi:phosphoglucomutase